MKRKKSMKNKRITNEELLESINRSFSNLEQKLESKIEIVDQNIQATRREVMNIGDKYVSYSKFDELASRVTKLEKNKK